MKVEILREADEELNEAIAYYEEIEAGLGIRLKEEVRDAIQWISNNAEIPRLRPKGYRRVNLKVFRYYVAILSGTIRFGFWLSHMVPDIPNTGSAERVKLLDVIGKKMKAENRNKFQLSTFNFGL